MEYFPRRGVELSENCELLFPAAEHDRPAILARYENGWRSGRFRTERPIYTFTIRFAGSADDFGLMKDFISAHGVVVPFTVVHPDYGTGVAFLVQQKHQIPKVVGGNPPWFRIEIPVEAQF